MEFEKLPYEFGLTEKMYEGRKTKGEAGNTLYIATEGKNWERI